MSKMTGVAYNRMAEMDLLPAHHTRTDPQTRFQIL